MATGTGNLPNPGMSFSPFAILTAEEMNDIVANIESLATGAGIGDGAIATADIANGAITPAKTTFPVSVEGNSSLSVVVPPSKKVAIWVQARDYDSTVTLNLAATGANSVANLLDGVYSDQVNQTVVGIRLYTFANEGSTTLTLTGGSGSIGNTKIIAIPMVS